MSEHHCPIIGCDRAKADFHVCCSRHWAQVPRELRNEIWRLYRTEPGSDAHRTAVLAAIQELNARQPQEVKVPRG